MFSAKMHLLYWEVKVLFLFSLVLNHIFMYLHLKFMYLHPKITPNSDTSLESLKKKITAHTKSTYFGLSLSYIYVCNNSTLSNLTLTYLTTFHNLLKSKPLGALDLNATALISSL